MGTVKTEKALVGYADSDWASDRETHMSVTSYLLLLNQFPIVWRSNLEASVTLLHKRN